MAHWQHLIFRFRLVLSVFIAGLVISGITAFPLLAETNWLAGLMGIDPAADPGRYGGLAYWVAFVRKGLEETYQQYPFVGYGTDWLGFAHIVIALFFLGPLRRPGQEEWVLVAGIIACLLVVPFALIAGELRGIPMGWRLLDCAFGVVGVIPLVYCLRAGRRIRREVVG